MLRKLRYRSPDNRTESLIKIKDGIFVSPHDPNFAEKYLHYNPTSKEMLYTHANKLSAEGDPDAIKFFKKAATYGHIPSMGKLLELEKGQKERAVKIIHLKRRRDYWYIICLLLILLAAALLLLAFLHEKFLFQKTEYHYYYGSNLVSNEYSGIASNSFNDKPWTAQQLSYVVLYNAIENYRETEGRYPDRLSQLTDKPPNNWISFIPSGVSYEKKENGYSLFQSGTQVPSEPLRLKLYFYPDVNKLGLVLGEQLLAIYPVAAGSEGNGMPFVTSSVVNRVVDPNGGNGVLGTRGLELTNNFAIHGTNDETSIGTNVTLGCLRMLNGDIENIYPYVAKGSLFKIVKGEPDQAPLFVKGLPPNANDINLSKEKTPETIYHWRQ